MICALTAMLVGVHTYGALYTACVYRCPREASKFYYHYPHVIRVPYNSGCPVWAKVGERA